MYDKGEVLLKIKSVSVTQLQVWVSEEWVRPAQGDADYIFNDADLARIRLLDFLENQLEVGNEAMPIILSLIDQVHDLREQLRIISDVIETQSGEVRETLLKTVQKR